MRYEFSFTYVRDDHVLTCIYISVTHIDAINMRILQFIIELRGKKIVSSSDIYFKSSIILSENTYYRIKNN